MRVFIPMERKTRSYIKTVEKILGAIYIHRGLKLLDVTIGKKVFLI
jgi:hypothetical protein